MKSSRPLKTVQRLIEKHADKIDEYWIEEDGFGDADELGGFSYWIYFKKGWINYMTETHCIHECTAKDVKEHFKYIEKCECESCTT
jgi:hypothetical protein